MALGESTHASASRLHRLRMASPKAYARTPLAAARLPDVDELVFVVGATASVEPV